MGVCALLKNEFVRWIVGGEGRNGRGYGLTVVLLSIQ